GQSAGDLSGPRGPTAQSREDDLTDAEQIAELCRTGPVTRTQLEARPYLALRRAWGEYRRLREERARLRVLVAHQLSGLFPEFLRVWADLLQPGALAVLRTGLTPAAMAALSLREFVAQVRANGREALGARSLLADAHGHHRHIGRLQGSDRGRGPRDRPLP